MATMPLPRRRNLRTRSLAMALACSQHMLMRASRRQAKRTRASPVSVNLGSRAALRLKQARASRIKHLQVRLRPTAKSTQRVQPSSQPSSQPITANQQLGCPCRPTYGPRRGRRGWNRPAPAPCCGHIGTLARTCATRKPPAGLNAASFCSVCCKTWGTPLAHTPSGPRVCHQTRQHCPPLPHSRKVPMWQTPMFSGLGPCSSRPEE